MPGLSEAELTGRARTHVIDVSDPPCTLHAAAAEAFLGMRGEAAGEGIELTPVSSFRDFDTQLRIWNEKFRGRRPLYDRQGRPLDRGRLTDEEAVAAILHWSALPGASRHHWGSEIDLIDAAALPAGHRARLLPAEYAPDGPFARMTAWLERNMGRFGFFRPYSVDRGGVAPEPWHLSYAPVSAGALEQLSVEVLRRTLEDCDIDGRDIVLARLDEIHARYVAAIDPP